MHAVFISVPCNIMNYLIRRFKKKVITTVLNPFFAIVPYFLDFHENIRFSKTLIEYQEQPYPLEKTTTVFLDPPKKHVTFVGYSWNSHGIFLYSIFPAHYFGIFSGISLEIFPIILGISQGNVPRIFQERIFAR